MTDIDVTDTAAHGDSSTDSAGSAADRDLAATHAGDTPAATDRAATTAAATDTANTTAVAADAADAGTTADEADAGTAADEADAVGDDPHGEPHGDAGTDAQSAPDSLLVREGDIAADYLERLLDIADYDGDIDLDVENGRAVVAIVGGNLRPLVGQNGETLDALQELTRLAVQQQTGARSRLMLDVSGHRKARRDELGRLATDTAATVTASGEAVRLAPMNPFERKVVHDAIGAIAGVMSESEGEEPHRRVVVLAQR